MQTFCPKCGTKLGADESLIGKQVQCGKCGNRFTVTPIESPAPSAGETEKTPEVPATPMPPIGGDLPPIGEPTEAKPAEPAAPKPRATPPPPPRPSKPPPIPVPAAA